MRAKEDTTKANFILFASIDSLKNYQHPTLGEHDHSKMIYFVTNTINNNTAMGGIHCKLDENNRIDPSEYKKIEKISQENDFIGFVKDSQF